MQMWSSPHRSLLVHVVLNHVLLNQDDRVRLSPFLSPVLVLLLLLLHLHFRLFRPDGFDRLGDDLLHVRHVSSPSQKAVPSEHGIDAAGHPRRMFWTSIRMIWI